MPRQSTGRGVAVLVADAARRPPREIAGDIRDRLAVLLNTTEILRHTEAVSDPKVAPGLRTIERQVECLGRLADELGRE